VTTTTKPRCTVPDSPTCVLPAIDRDSKQHTCSACRRVWRVETDQRGQRYWRWDGHTTNKKAVTR